MMEPLWFDSNHHTLSKYCKYLNKNKTQPLIELYIANFYALNDAIMPSKLLLRLVFIELFEPTMLSMAANCLL